ncbi:MAG: hypothetical protein Q8T08_15150, partial [Ignavibacteria bacterium]|nr:hypothetical protein [Ignavibacteria bacterium]
FWDYLKDQLYSETTWDQSDLLVIENEIGKYLSKLERKDFVKLWESTDAAMDKLDLDETPDAAEMKTDLTNDILGQVMDRMDDNYSGSSYYTPAESYVAPEEEKPAKSDGEGDIADDIEPKELDEEFDFEETDLFEDEDFDVDENNNS